jgi:hypothetical protein
VAGCRAVVSFGRVNPCLPKPRASEGWTTVGAGSVVPARVPGTPFRFPATEGARVPGAVELGLRGQVVPAEFVLVPGKRFAPVVPGLVER